MEALEPGDPRTMGDYRLLGRLGAGGMGRVFLGRSPGGRVVAVKLVHAEIAGDPGFRRRFRREVEAARRVGGAWTAPVLDADTDSDAPWVATGYVPGPSLDDLVERHGPLPAESVQALASGLARALQAVHAAGLIHRDLKPSNVLVTIDGPRVIDFGIVKSVDGSVLTRTGALVGTPAFMSPEQVRGGELGPASDVFSLGSVLAYAATGRRPYGTGVHGVHALLLQVAQGSPDLGDLSGPVRDLVEACLARAPEDRPEPTAVLDSLPAPPPSWLPAGIVAELGRHAAGLLDLEAPEPAAPAPAPSEPLPPSATPTAPLTPRRASRTRTYLATGAAAAAAVVAIGAAIFLSGDRTDADEPRHPSESARGDVPANMLGTWDGWAGKAGTTQWTHRRITLSQGELGANVATIRVVLDGLLCEYTGTLTSASPSVQLRPRLTRSVPPGQCQADGTQTMTLNGSEVHWALHDVAGTLHRARHGTVPDALRGHWTGTSGGLSAVATEGMRREFVLDGGAVGTEAVKISTTNPAGLRCESTALLVSAESDILAFPNRLVTQNPRCVLGGLQKLTPRGEALQWENPETGEAANLHRT